MRTGRPKALLTVSSDERAHLLAITRSHSLPAALTLRASIVLACEHEPSNAVVATRLGVGPHTIGKWRKRFIADRIDGLYDEMRTGRPRTVEDEAVAELITKTFVRRHQAATRWSVRAIAKETGIAKSTVHRLLQTFGLQSRCTSGFKLSTDPFLVEKLRDVVGLYLNPPDKAVVLCVDEKSQIQALARTTPLFAALDELDGAIVAQSKPCHRHQEFLAFLRRIKTSVPDWFDIHLVVDDYAAYKHPKVRAWFARHPHWHMHFTPTYESWIDHVERTFASITHRAIARSSFESIADLVKKIDRFVRNRNANVRPFVWTATADSILHSRDFVSEFPGQNAVASEPRISPVIICLDECQLDGLSVACEHRVIDAES